MKTSHPSVVSILRHVPLFASLSEEQLTYISTLIVEREVGKGEMVTFEGHPAEGLYFVARGSFKRFKIVGKREQILKLLHPGDSFGEVPLLDGGPDPASTQALEPSHLYILPCSRFEALLHDSPDLAFALIRFLTGRLRYFTDLVEDLSLPHVNQRVAKLILEWCDTDDLSNLTQSDMAALIGTVREVVGRALHELERRRAIHVERGHITVCDRDLLAAIAGVDVE